MQVANAAGLEGLLIASSSKTYSLHSNEGIVQSLLKGIFQGEHIDLNVRKKSNVKYPSTGSYMEFDIWIPKYRLCFEFQDPYHYVTVWYNHSPHQLIQHKDDVKKTQALQNDMTLVVVPCWWDGTVDSLAASICFQRPDLSSHFAAIGNAIHYNPPSDYFPGATISNVGELMLAAFPYHRFHQNQHLWWMGEKYDGVRCCWDATEKTLYSRNGSEISVLPVFLQQFPQVFIDGELWFGRREFSAAYVLVNGTAHPTWSSLRVVCFDVPEHSQHHHTYEERYACLLRGTPTDDCFNQIATRLLNNQEYLDALTQAIIDDGGEGVILQRHASRYEQGRSSSLVKIKGVALDQEGIVVGVDKDKSVVLKLASGKIFTVPADSVLIPTPTTGEVVTFSVENNLRRDVPVNAKIFRVRPDLSWDDVVQNFVQEKHHLTEKSQRGVTIKVKGYWTTKNMRKYLEAFARRRNMNPLLPGTWYHSFNTFMNSSSGKTILAKFNNGYFHALSYLFPEITFDRSAFSSGQAYFKVENRRKIFEKYAAFHQFDPLIAHNWYPQSIDSFLAFKGVQSAILYHSNSVTKALADLFPNIGIDRSKFTAIQSFWEKPANRRKLFEKYASENGFDPLQAEHWYKQSRNNILDFKGVQLAILYHGRSVGQALQDLFPEVGLERLKFLFQHNIWKSASNRRRFFENYARKYGFNPLSAEAWYLQPRDKIIAERGALGVISYHNGKVATALLDLFPSIGLDKTRFLFSKKDWHKPEVRRKFLENYAKENAFDPLNPTHWYTLNKQEFLALPGAQRVISYHKRSIAWALLDLFPDIGLDAHKLGVSRLQRWDKPENQRKFFENYAKVNQFDPLIPRNWYLQPRQKILAVQGAHGVLDHLDGSIPKALIKVFPNIGLDVSKFHYRLNYWDKSHNQLQFFEDYASKYNFDPLNPDNWYSQPKQRIMAAKGAHRVVHYHGSLANALQHLLPDIGLDSTRLQGVFR